MNFNLLVIALTALLPVVVASFFYLQGKNQSSSISRLIGRYVLLYLGSFLMTFTLIFLVIHQAHLGSLLAMQPNFPDPNTEAGAFYAQGMAKFGHLHRSFGHGVLHGSFAGLFFVLPVLGFRQLGEAQGFSWKNLLLEAGVWTVLFAVMGGTLCAFA